MAAVSYPRFQPRYGQRLGWIVFRAVLAAMAGWVFADPGDLAARLSDGNPVSLAFTLSGLVLLIYGGYLGLRVLLDLAAPATVTGEVIEHRLWQSRQSSDDFDSRTFPVNYHLAINDGRTDPIRAWVLPAHLADTCRVGDLVTARVRPWTRRVLTVTVQRLAPGTDPYDVRNDGTLDPAAVDAGQLLTAGEVGRVVGQRVSPQTSDSREDRVRTVQYVGANGQPILTFALLGGGYGSVTLAAARMGSTRLVGVGDEAYGRPDQVVGRLGDAVLVLKLNRKAKVDPAQLPALLSIAITRLPGTTPPPAS